MTMPQIAAMIAALAVLAGLLAVSAKWKVRPWVVLLAAVAGVVFALLMGLLLRRVGSLGSLAAGILLIVFMGLLLCVATFMLSQRVARRAPDRENVYRPAHAVRRGSPAAEDPLDSLALAQVSETALLSEKAPSKPALRLVKPEETAAPAGPEDENAAGQGAPDGAEGQEAQAQACAEPQQGAEGSAAEDQPALAAEAPSQEVAALDEELKQLEEGFRLEQERLAREEEKRRAREQVARERRERREEERRMKEEQIRQADEAQKVRERIRQERERVAEQDRLKLEPAQSAARTPEEAKDAAQPALSEPDAAAEAWEQEARRLERELEERRREQEKAAEAEKLWLQQQEHLAREQEEQRLERERQEAQRKRCAEAEECLGEGAGLLSRGQRMQALPVLEKAARMDVPNDVKVRANLMILETLAALGWKAEALKRMQAMRTGLAIDAETKKRLGELASKLLG